MYESSFLVFGMGQTVHSLIFVGYIHMYIHMYPLKKKNIWDKKSPTFNLNNVIGKLICDRPNFLITLRYPRTVFLKHSAHQEIKTGF